MTWGQYKFDAAIRFQIIGFEPSQSDYYTTVDGRLHYEKSIGIFYNVMVGVDHLIFLTNIVIQDCVVNFEITIILE